MTDCGLALTQMDTESADVVLTFGQDQEDPKPSGITGVLQEDRRATRLAFLAGVRGAFARFR